MSLIRMPMRTPSCCPPWLFFLVSAKHAEQIVCSLPGIFRWHVFLLEDLLWQTRILIVALMYTRTA